LLRAGDQLDAALRVAVDRLLGSLKQLPQPRMLASDIRRRPIGFRSAGQLLAACVRDGAPVSASLSIAEAVHTFTLGLYGNDVGSARECWTHETREQGEADVAQVSAMLTLNEGDLDRAIEQTEQEIGAKRAFLLCLMRARDGARARRMSGRSS
jgi:hypothetical protein